MSSQLQPGASTRRPVWPAIGASVLLVWTGLMHYLWIEWHPLGLHCVPAFFLGLLLLVLLGGLGAMLRSVRNAPKDATSVRPFRITLGRGARWLFSREPWRICGWTLLFAVSVIVLFYNVERWRGKWAWAAVQREARARNEPLDVKDANPAPVADDLNVAKAPPFAPLLAVLTKDNPFPEDGWRVDLGPLEPVAQWGGGRPSGKQIGGGVARAPWLDRSVTDFSGWLAALDPNQALPGASRSRAALQFPPRGTGFPGQRAKPSVSDNRTPGEIAEGVLAALQPFESDLKQLREFSSRPFCRFPLDYPRQMLSEDQVTPVLMGYVRILSVRASARLVLGQDDAALDDVHLILRLVDYSWQQPWTLAIHRRSLILTEGIQPIWEGLQSHRWSPAQLEALQRQLENMDLLGGYPVTVRNDAFAQADFWESIVPTSGKPRVPIFQRKEPDIDRITRLFQLVYPTGWSLQNQAAVHRYHLDVSSRGIDMKDRTVPQPPGPDAEPQASSDPLFRVFVVPRTRELFSGAMEDCVRAQTLVNEAALACALERYRLARGSFPEALEALVPDFAAKLPHDIINGKPLAYRRTTDGFILCSIGINGEDDNGWQSPRPEGYIGRFPQFNLGDWVWATPAQTKP